MPAGWLEQKEALQHRVCCGDHDAINYLKALMQVVEAWDDIVDRDNPYSEAQVHEAFVLALVGIPVNAFYQRNQIALHALMVTCINAWLDANQMRAEDDRRLRNIAFHIRNMGLEFYSLCAFLTGGWQHMRAVSVEIRRFFALEDFEVYDDA